MPSVGGEPGTPRLPRHSEAKAGHASRCGYPLSTIHYPLSATSAFSLIELLVTVTLLTFIIFGLLLMFNQTQRAFKNGMAQVDILEGGRASMDMMVRDLQQMTPTQGPDFYVQRLFQHTVNFLAELDPKFSNPLLQGLPGATNAGAQIPRTNVLQHFFFQTRQNQDWIGTGYIVVPDDANGVVGSLYRFCITNTPRFGPNTNCLAFLNVVSASLPVIQARCSRIADGVVHLRLRPFDVNGAPLTASISLDANDRTSPWGLLLLSTNTPPLAGVTSGFGKAMINCSAVLRTANSVLLDDVDCLLWSNAVPAYVELELGILEPDNLKRYRALAAAGSVVQRNYLYNHVAQVQIFRQRVPTSNVDFTAYQ